MTSKLDEIIDEFADLDARERLELLLDFSDGMPELPPEYQARRDAGENRVHECQTPVFLWIDVEDGHVSIHADVAPEAPTVKGFVAVLIEAFSGAPCEDVIQTGTDVLRRMGLVEALGMQRARGLNAVLYRIRQEVARQSNGSAKQ